MTGHSSFSRALKPNLAAPWGDAEEFQGGVQATAGIPARVTQEFYFISSPRGQFVCDIHRVVPDKVEFAPLTPFDLEKNQFLNDFKR
ncbi:hypothetical protein CDAR_289781 [Caerostris darwini]|uniref:Uncharacterized protein n=1 Tax=Caerostris darwini TaxID=1538125 RepID=A0AAV4WX73_9ARAC|nr:hypothetical protein CDAR_289781 [Caerostris darwini]